MGSRVEKHLSRLAMPKTWKVKRKGIKWVTRPLPGAHSLKLGMPINIILRDVLKLAKTTKEVKNILNNQEILVDGVRRKNHKLIVGLMDIISIPKIKQNFRILLDKKGHIIVFPISQEEAKIKLCEIKGKTAAKKGKLQLNLYDGKNILVDKTENKVGDVVVIELPSQKIKESLKLEKGSIVYLTGGKYIGETGVVVETTDKMIIYKKGKDTHKTLKKYAFVVGKDKLTTSILSVFISLGYFRSRLNVSQYCDN